MTNESDLEETTGGGFKRPEPEEKKESKVKEFFKKTGSGAKVVGSTVAKGASSLAKKGYTAYKTYNSPESKQARLDAQEAKLERELRIAQQKERIRKLQPQRQTQSSGRSPLGGFGGIDMGNVFGGGSGGGRIGNPNAMNVFSGGGSMGGMGNLNSAMDALGGTPRRAMPRAAPRVKRTRGKKGKRRATRRTTRRTSTRQRAFNPFSQI